MSTPLVCAIVLNYQNADETIACVNAVQELGYPRVRILVLDNCSSDGSQERIEQALPGVEVLQTGRNLGYGHGNNLGIRNALAAGADFVWLLTPDVRVQPRSLDALVDAMIQNTELGICGPVIHAGKECIVSSRLHPRLGWFASHTVRGEAELSGLPAVLPTDYVDGCAIMIRGELVEDIGLLREDFFLYYEETEYCARATLNGWRVSLVSQSHVHTRPISEERNEREYYMVRNSVLLARIRGQFLVRTLARHAFTALLHTSCLFRQNTHSLVSSTWRGISEGLRKPLCEPPEVQERGTSRGNR